MKDVKGNKTVSVDQVVFLSRDRLPTTKRWQAALDAAMLPVKLDATCEISSHSGCWPAEYEGVASGFEFYLFAADQAAFEVDEAELGGRDKSAGFVTHSDYTELKAACAAAAALAIVADGLYFDEDADALITGEQSLDIARDVASRS